MKMPAKKKPVAKETPVPETSFQDLPDEVIYGIVEFLDMRPVFDPHARPGAGLNWIASFGLTCQRIHRITGWFPPFWARANLTGPQLALPAGPAKPEDIGELRSNLATYPAMLEPVMHGGHVEQPRMGYVGAATLLAFLHQGQLVPWRLDPEDLQAFRKSPDDMLAALETAIRKRVKKYAGLMQIADQVKAQIQVKFQGNPKLVKQLINENPQVGAARASSPIDLFEKVLIENLSRARPDPAELDPGWEREKLGHQQKTRTLVLSGKSGIAEYDKLAATGEEDKAYGHSEQLWMMSGQWRDRLAYLVRTAERIVLALALRQGTSFSGQKITLFCNRSPCTSCGRYLVVELENFWKLLKRRLALKLTDAETQQLFSQVFVFQLVYTSLYKEGEEYPNPTILKALERAGWHTVKIEAIPPKKRKNICLSEIKVEEVTIDLEALEKRQEELESRDEHKEELDPQFLEMYRQEPRRSTRSSAKRRKTYRNSSDEDMEEGEEKGNRKR